MRLLSLQLLSFCSWQYHCFVQILWNNTSVLIVWKLFVLLDKCLNNVQFVEKYLIFYVSGWIDFRIKRISSCISQKYHFDFLMILLYRASFISNIFERIKIMLFCPFVLSCPDICHLWVSLKQLFTVIYSSLCAVQM